MKKKTKRALDLALDDYFDGMVTGLTATAVDAHILGDLIAYRNLGIPVAEFRVQQAALDFGKEYSKLLKSEGASVINGTKIAWLQDHSEQTRSRVYEIIEQGLKEGKPVASIGGKKGVEGTIAHDLKVTGVREFDFQRVRIARTESARIMNSGTLNRYKLNNITHVNVIDGDSDPGCLAANGSRWSVEFAETHTLEHPNCIRSFSPIINDDWEPPEE